MKKRGRKVSIKINLTNRWLYTLIAIGILAIIGVGVYAYGTSNPSTFGHSAGELAPPIPCSSGQFLKFDGTNWVCSLPVSEISGTYYYAVSLASCGYNTHSDQNRWPICYGDVARWSSAAGAASANFDVNLPNGAVVTEFSTWAESGVTLVLKRAVINSYSPTNNLAQTSGTGSDSSIDYATIDNMNYKYFVNTGISSGTKMIYGIRIKYTL